MYERMLEGRELGFGHQGMLYQDSFVMYDRQTDSLWVQATGEAFFGPLKGKRLTFVPSTLTTWAQWKASFPHTLVLGGKRAGDLMGTYDGMKQTRNLGLAVVVRFKGKLYTLDALKTQPLVNDRLNGVPIVVYFSEADGTATAWSRTVEGRTLTFRVGRRKDGRGNLLLEDEQTGSAWAWLTGEAVAGPLRGKQLGQLSAYPILTDRFRIFYPGAPIFAAR